MSDMSTSRKTNETKISTENSIKELHVPKLSQNSQRHRATQLPLARVRAIMKMSPGQVQNLSKDCIFLVSQATVFIFESSKMLLSVCLFVYKTCCL